MRKTFAALMLALSMQFAYAQEPSTCEPLPKFLEEFNTMAAANNIRYATTELLKEQVIKVVIAGAADTNQKVPENFFDGLTGGLLIQSEKLSIVVLIKDGKVCNLATVKNDLIKRVLGISAIGKEA